MKHVAIPAAASLIAAALLPAPVARAGDWGGLFSAVMLATDYRYQGVSSSDNHPVVQGYVHYWRPDNWYAGIFATQVDYNDVGTDYELDIYAGRNLDLADRKTRLTAEVMATVFPDNKTPGPTYDFVQFKLGARRAEGPLTVIGTTSFVPKASYGSGQAYRVEGEAAFALTRRLRLKGLAGRRWIERGSDRNYWSLGVEATWKHLTLELRYQDTSLSKARCGYNPDICGPSIGAVLTAALPPIV